MEKIELLVFYGNSHKNMFLNYFLPTYNLFLAENFYLNHININEDRGFTWGTKAFNIFVRKKVKIIYDRLLSKKDGEFLLYSDVDIIFLENISDRLSLEMGDNDIVFSRDYNKWISYNSYCTGFMLIRKSQKIIDMFKELLDRYVNDKDDQDLMNVIIKEFCDIKYTFLSDYFFNIPLIEVSGKLGFLGVVLKEMNMSYKDKPGIAETIFKVAKQDKRGLFHANFLKGVEDKEFILEIVKNVFLPHLKF